MDIRKEIIENVIYSGDFDSIRGQIVGQNLIAGSIHKEDFTEALFWTEGTDIYEMACSSEVMVLYCNGKFHGVAKAAASFSPVGWEKHFTTTDGALSLSAGML